MIKKTEWKTTSPEGRWYWYNPVSANSCGGVAVAHMYLKVKVKATDK